MNSYNPNYPQQHQQYQQQQQQRPQQAPSAGAMQYVNQTGMVSMGSMGSGGVGSYGHVPPLAPSQQQQQQQGVSLGSRPHSFSMNNPNMQPVAPPLGTGPIQQQQQYPQRSPQVQGLSSQVPHSANESLPPQQQTYPLQQQQQQQQLQPSPNTQQPQSQLASISGTFNQLRPSTYDNGWNDPPTQLFGADGKAIVGSNIGKKKRQHVEQPGMYHSSSTGNLGALSGAVHSGQQFGVVPGNPNYTQIPAQYNSIPHSASVNTLSSMSQQMAQPFQPSGQQYGMQQQHPGMGGPVGGPMGGQYGTQQQQAGMVGQMNGMIGVQPGMVGQMGGQPGMSRPIGASANGYEQQYGQQFSQQSQQQGYGAGGAGYGNYQQGGDNGGVWGKAKGFFGMNE